MPKGRIAKLVSERGFGFIRDGRDDHVFFHASSVKDRKFDDLAEGDAVVFEWEDGDQGRKATHVDPS